MGLGGLTGCLTDAEDDRFRYMSAYVLSVTILSSTPDDVRFHVSGAFPTPCYDLVETEIRRLSPRSYSVSLVGRAPLPLGCSANLGAFETDVETEVPRGGFYQFVFVNDGLDPVVLYIYVA
jgi:hypothetical protein